MNVIVEIHCRVFDPEGRAIRQLGELRSLMTVLWDASSDVIVISVRRDDGTTSMLSPSFTTMVDAPLPKHLRGREAIGLYLCTSTNRGINPQEENNGVRITKASYVDSSEMPYGALLRDSVLSDIGNQSEIATKACSLVAEAWKPNPDPLCLHTLTKMDGSECKCELKITRRSGNTTIAIVRDVSERYKRFEAERRVHRETLARQEEAQSVRRSVAGRSRPCYCRPATDSKIFRHISLYSANPIR